MHDEMVSMSCSGGQDVPDLKIWSFCEVCKILLRFDVKGVARQTLIWEV